MGAVRIAAARVRMTEPVFGPDENVLGRWEIERGVVFDVADRSRAALAAHSREPIEIAFWYRGAAWLGEAYVLELRADVVVCQGTGAPRRILP